MKFSKYIVCYRKKNSVILFSTITKAIVELDKEKFKDYSLLSSEEVDALKKMCFLIEDDFDEKKRVWHIINKDRLNPISLVAYIMFTEECNFRCQYCYQNEQVNSRNLSEDSMNYIIDWLSKKLSQSNYKQCNIDLYGGEPLLYKDKLLVFSKKMHEVCIERGVELKLRLITNGFLLSNEIIEQLMLFGLRDIHISLDGMKDVHDTRRPLMDGSGTFDEIVENIKNTEALSIPKTIRIGFDKSNIERIPELLRFFAEQVDLSRTEVYFSPIYQTTAQISNMSSFCSNNVLDSSKALIESYKFLFKSAFDLGIRIPTYISAGPCMALADDAVIFDTDGFIFKCVDMIGINELIIGKANADVYFPKYYEFIRGEALEACINKGCKFAPLCGGGCAMVGYTREKKIGLTDCKSTVFEKVNQFLLSLI